MNRIRKGQVHGIEKGDIMGQVALITSLFGVAAFTCISADIDLQAGLFK